MHKLRRLTQKEYPKLPYFMLGHSMGSYLLRRYLAEHGEGLSGAVIMGTGSMPGIATGFGIVVVKLLAKRYGWHHRSRLVQLLTYTKPYRRYDLTGKSPKDSWLTKDEQIVKAYYKEPRCSFVFTLNGYLGLFETVRYDGSRQNIAKIPRSLPLLLVAGEDDPVGDLGKGVRRVYRKYKKSGILDVTLKLYPGDRHEILNETDRQSVYRDILKWLDRRQS